MADSIIETSLCAIVVTDTSGCITRFNDAFLEMFGCTREEVAGRCMIEFAPWEPGRYETTAGETIEIDEDFFKKTREMVAALFKDGRVPRFESFGFRKDGKVIRIYENPALIYNEQGEVVAAATIIQDITESKLNEKKLKALNKELEQRVEERTAELEAKTKRLEETNVALNVLLEKRDEDKKELGEKVLLNVRELILPYIEKLKKDPAPPERKTLLEIIERNLTDIVSPFLHSLSLKFFNLTSTELKIAALIRGGKSSQEIANTLYLSKNTIDAYRDSIRRKLGIKNKKINLKTHLMTFE